MDPVDIHRRVVELLEAGTPFCLATLIDLEGHGPRGRGTRMIIFEDGSIEGTIGGGRFEALVIHDAVEALEEGAGPRTGTYPLTKADLGMYCAGKAHVLLEPHRLTDRLVVFGGGHVGQALVEVAAAIGGWHVSVIDDRPAFADPDRHPRADRVVHTDEAYGRDVPELDENAYVAVVTRCHDVDKHVLERLVEQDLAYLGMIGSASKARTLLSELEKEGCPREALDRVRTPIGLPIGGKAPGEIALSILAEMQVVRDRRRREAGDDRPHPARERSGETLAALRDASDDATDGSA